MDRTTPPSARTPAPLMAAASGLQTKATTAAISSEVMKRCKNGTWACLFEKLVLEGAAFDALFCREPVYKIYDPLRRSRTRQYCVHSDGCAGGGFSKFARYRELGSFGHTVMNHLHRSIAANVVDEALRNKFLNSTVVREVFEGGG